MRISIIQDVITRAMADSGFRRALFSDPDRALAGYDLTANEAEAMRGYTPDQLDRFVGGILIHQFVPVQASRRVVILPPWYSGETAPGQIAIRLSGELVFGNGGHPSTGLCLEALEDRLRSGERVLDLGTGTGILAIAAAKLGAGSALALDIEPGAVRAAQEHVRANGEAEIVEVRQGSLAEALAAAGDGFDFVCANLLAPILADVLDGGLIRAVRPGGMFVLSGMVRTQLAPILDILKKKEVEIVKRRFMDQWAAVIARRKSSSRNLS